MSSTTRIDRERAVHFYYKPNTVKASIQDWINGDNTFVEEVDSDIRDLAELLAKIRQEAQTAKLENPIDPKHVAYLEAHKAYSDSLWKRLGELVSISTSTASIHTIECVEEYVAELEQNIAELEQNIAELEKKIADEQNPESLSGMMRFRGNKAINVLEREGWRWCDVAACNCNSWHAPVKAVVLEAEALKAELDKAWAATGVAGTVRGLTTLDDVIATEKRSANKAWSRVFKLEKALADVHAAVVSLNTTTSEIMDAR